MTLINLTSFYPLFIKPLLIIDDFLATSAGCLLHCLPLAVSLLFAALVLLFSDGVNLFLTPSGKYLLPFPDVYPHFSALHLAKLFVAGEGFGPLYFPPDFL